MKNDILEQIKRIEHGKGIQHILDEACRLLGNPVVIHDMDYTLIAHTKSGNDDPIWGEFMRYGRVQSETLQMFADESFVDAVANSTMGNGVTFLTSDKLKYNRIFGQLYNKKREPVADMVMIEVDTRFSPAIKEEIRALCDCLSDELGESAFYNDYGQSYREGILKKLIEGGIGDIRQYTGHVANLDCGLKTLYAAVVDVSRAVSGATLVHYRDRMQAAQPYFSYYIYNDRIVILIGCEDDILDELHALTPLCRLFEQEALFAGISTQFDNLFELKAYYDQACDALGLCFKQGAGKHICLYKCISDTDIFL